MGEANGILYGLKRWETLVLRFLPRFLLLESLFESNVCVVPLVVRCAWFGVLSFSGVHRQEVRHLRAALSQLQPPLFLTNDTYMQG